MAARHASEAEILLQSLMAPAIAFAKSMQDPEKAKACESLSLVELTSAQVELTTNEWEDAEPERPAA
jgi:hypothetical protein